MLFITKIIGYHDTCKDKACEIKQSGFKIFENPYNDHWLSDGIYLYEKKEFAYIWSKSRYKISGKTLKIEVSCNRNEIINLDECQAFIELLKIIMIFNKYIGNNKLYI